MFIRCSKYWGSKCESLLCSKCEVFFFEKKIGSKYLSVAIINLLTPNIRVFHCYHQTGYFCQTFRYTKRENLHPFMKPDTPQKSTIYTKNNGLEDVSPFKHGYVGYSSYVRFKGCTSIQIIPFSAMLACATGLSFLREHPTSKH